MTTELVFERVDKLQNRTQLKLKEMIEPVLDKILGLYVQGRTMDEVVEQLGMDLPPWRLRDFLVRHHAGLYAAAREERAHSMVERNLRDAEAASNAGELKTAIDARFKVAALTHPKEYSERAKVELTGADGGALQIKADLTLTPAEAYERMLGRAK